jgi:SAM-dependent methyltransferase
MAQANENLHAVVFDLDPVLEAATEFIDAYAMGDRVSVMGGDYMTDDLGHGYDLIWASSCLSFAKNNLDPLITKIHTALNPGGYFISLHDGLTHEKTRPDTDLSGLGGLLNGGGDHRFEQGEIADAMLRCSFCSVRSRTIETPGGPLDLDVARK